MNTSKQETGAGAAPRRGATFRHPYYQNPSNNEQLLCKVTRIAYGVVYYRPVYGQHEDGSEWLGAPTYISVWPFVRHTRSKSPANSDRLAAIPSPNWERILRNIDRFPKGVRMIFQ